MAKTQAEYINEAIQGMQSEREAENKRLTDQAAATWNAWNEGATGQLNVAKDAIAQQQEATRRQYEKVFDTNALQEMVSRRQTEVAMANAGLTDSGLNRSQQTAISLTRGNADRDTRLAQQGAVDALSQQLAAMQADFNAQSLNQRTSIDNQAADAKAAYWANLLGIANTSGSNAYSTAVGAEDRARELAAQQAQWDRSNALQQKANDLQAQANAKTNQYDMYQYIFKTLLDKDGYDAASANMWAQYLSGSISQEQLDAWAAKLAGQGSGSATVGGAALQGVLNGANAAKASGASTGLASSGAIEGPVPYSQYPQNYEEAARQALLNAMRNSSK